MLTWWLPGCIIWNYSSSFLFRLKTHDNKLNHVIRLRVIWVVNVTGFIFCTFLAVVCLYSKFTMISDSLGGHDVHDSTTVRDTFTPVDLPDSPSAQGLTVGIPKVGQWHEIS